MSIEHKKLDYLKSRFEDGDRPTGEDFTHLLDSCHNTEQHTDVKIKKSLNVEGTTTLQSAAQIDASLTTTGPVILKSTLHVDGPMSITSTARVSNDLTVNGATLLNQGMLVAGTSVFSDSVNINGPLLATSTVNVASDTTVGGNLTVVGSSLLNSAQVLQDLHVKGDLTVDGNAYLNANVDGTINVGDNNTDNINFIADIDSDINVNVNKQYNLGSATKQWSNVFTNNISIDANATVNGSIIVNGEVDGRKISIDGTTLDDVRLTVSTTSSFWDTSYAWGDHGAAGYWVDNLQQRGNWDTAYSWGDHGNMGYWLDNPTHRSNWDTAFEWGDHNSAGYWLQDDGKINKWDQNYTTVNTNSAQWSTDKLVDFIDVDSSGVENNSILRYESSTNKWVASTVEDEVVKATAQLLIFDHGNDSEIPLHGKTLTLTDNHQDEPYRTITFTADSFTLSGEYTKVDSNNYVYGTQGLSASPVNMNMIASVVATAINTANAIGDISIKANTNDNVITLQQQFGGPGGNTDITGTATGNSSDAFIHGVSNQHNPAFEGGDNLNSFASLDDTPGGYGSDAGKFVKVNSANNGLEFIEHDTSQWDDTYSVVSTNSASWEETADINAIIESLSSVSANWNNTYTDVSQTSANWNNTYTDVSQTSANWNNTYTDVSQTSANWNNVYTDVSETSANWNNVYTDVSQTSANWNNTYTDVSQTSADWNNVYTDVSQTSANWNNTYTDVSQASADWNDVYSFVNTSSGAGTGFAVLDSTGKLVTDQIPELSITRVHVVQNPGDVVNLSPTEGIQIGDVVIVVNTFDNLIAVDTNPTGSFGSYVSSTKSYNGYNKLALPADLVQTINGNTGPHVILTTDDITTGSTNKFVTDELISNWNDIYNVVTATSSEWEESVDIQNVADNLTTLRNYIHTVSGDWNNVYTDVSQTSADWNDVYTDVSQASADWNDVYTDVSQASADWNDVYSFVNTDSATNNTTYNSDTFVDSAGDVMTGDLRIVGGELEVGGNATIAGDLIHQNDTGTRISFAQDIITLETNGQEYITIDGTASTPGRITINDPGEEPIHFIVKTVERESALKIDGTTGNIGVGMEPDASANVSVVGDVSLNGDVNISGDVSGKNATLIGDLTVNSNITTTGIITSGGMPLHDIFTTSDEIQGNLTVHGYVSADGDTFTTGSQYVSGDIKTDGDIDVSNLNVNNNVTTVNDAGDIKTGVTQDINIGGHILHIVNGLIVGVTDE